MVKAIGQVADDQWPAENLETLLTHLMDGSYDFVIGVRTNRSKIYSFWRRILSGVFNLVPQILFHTRTEDANGIKLGTRAIFDIPLQSKSYFAEIERIILAGKKGFKVGFKEIKFSLRTQGKAKGAKWRNIIHTLSDLIRFLFIGQFNLSGKNV